MNRKMIADEIKRAVTMEQLLSAYGYKMKRGRMMCPFHADRNASLQIYTRNNSWYCFGCKLGGSVIDFVMAQENCSFSTAVRAIDDSFGLNLVASDDPLDMDRSAEIRREIDRLAGLMEQHLDALDEYHEDVMTILTRESRQIYAKNKRELTAEEWTRKLALDDEMERIEDKMQQCREAREEVRAWRTSKYRELLTLKTTTERVATNRKSSSGAQSA